MNLAENGLHFINWMIAGTPNSVNPNFNLLEMGVMIVETAKLYG